MLCLTSPRWRFVSLELALVCYFLYAARLPACWVVATECFHSLILRIAACGICSLSLLIVVGGLAVVLALLPTSLVNNALKIAPNNQRAISILTKALGIFSVLSNVWTVASTSLRIAGTRRHFSCTPVVLHVF